MKWVQPSHIPVQLREMRCPACEESFGTPPQDPAARWPWLLAQVEAHLNANQAHGTDPTLPG